MCILFHIFKVIEEIWFCFSAVVFMNANAKASLKSILEYYCLVFSSIGPCSSVFTHDLVHRCSCFLPFPHRGLEVLTVNNKSCLFHYGEFQHIWQTCSIHKILRNDDEALQTFSKLLHWKGTLDLPVLVQTLSPKRKLSLIKVLSARNGTGRLLFYKFCLFW